MENIKMLLIDIIHHVEDHKAELFFYGRVSGDVLTEIKDRFKLVKNKTQAVSDQLDKIRKAAEDMGCKEVIDLINQDIGIK